MTTFFPSGVPTSTVTLNKNGGSGGSTSVTATFGSSMPSITVPTRTGTGNPEWTGDISSIGNEVTYGDGSYAFEGYFDDPTGGTKYYNADGTSASAWDKETNATLYAHWKSTDENFYVVGFKDGKVHLLTKYMVKPSTNMQSTDIVKDTDTVVFSSTDYWSSSASNYPYDLTTNTASITEADTPALYYAKQYGAKYGVNGTLLTKEEVDTLCGRTPDNNYVYSNYTGVTWPSWLTNQFYSDSTYGYFWLGSASGSNYVWIVYNRDSSYDIVQTSGLEYKYGIRPVIEIPVTTFFPSGVPTSTVTLNKNGGSGGSTSVTATFGSSMPSITVPTRTGTGNPEWTGDISSIGNEVSYGNGTYAFEGYFDDPTGGTKYYNADGTSASAWDK